MLYRRCATMESEVVNHAHCQLLQCIASNTCFSPVNESANIAKLPSSKGVVAGSPAGVRAMYKAARRVGKHWTVAKSSLGIMTLADPRRESRHHVVNSIVATV